MMGAGGDIVGSNNRLNITLGLGQAVQQQPPLPAQQQLSAVRRRNNDIASSNGTDDDNEILSISLTGTGESSIV